jgi:hypothetical protein
VLAICQPLIDGLRPAEEDTSIAFLVLMRYTPIMISSEFGVRSSKNFVFHLFEKHYSYPLLINGKNTTDK